VSGSPYGKPLGYERIELPRVLWREIATAVSSYSDQGTFSRSLRDLLRFVALMVYPPPVHAGIFPHRILLEWFLQLSQLSTIPSIDLHWNRFAGILGTTVFSWAEMATSGFCP